MILDRFYSSPSASSCLQGLSLCGKEVCEKSPYLLEKNDDEHNQAGCACYSTKAI